MSDRSRFVVPGEDVPPAIAAVLVAIGAMSAFGSAFALSGRDEPRGASVRDPGPPSSAAPLASAAAPPPSASAPPPPAAAPSSSSRAAAKCPPLVLNFKSGSAAPPPAARAPLASLGDWLKAHDDVVVFVDGHADATGTEDGNLRLSRLRASAVSAALESAGIAKARLNVRGFGSFWPVDEAPADSSWNRRVVVSTKGSACPRDQEEVIEP